MSISKDIGQVRHNNSGRITIHYSRNIDPLFELTLSTPDLVVTDEFSLKFKNSSILSRLRMASPVRECVTDSTRYVAISFGLRLLSDSLFHLGDHLISIDAHLENIYSHQTV